MGKNDNTNNSPYKYDAFISYRHCQPDQFVAQNLHKQLEMFKLPKNVAKKVEAEGKVTRTKISRVFRDQDELPLATNLADPIVEALKSSEWLIVICSPRLKESMWCRKEIETFISLHGRDKVMAVLVEGEPEDSFPDELLHRDVEVIRPDGTKEIISEPTEPLAADVRGENNKERLNAIKSELIRLLAPMFELEYDDLKQRHRERRVRKMVATAVTVAVICFLFGVLGTLSAITIYGQKSQIQKQADEIAAKSIEIEAQAEEISNQNDALKVNQAESLAQEAIDSLEDDNKYQAVSYAYDALTEFDGIKMPYTDSARFALMKSLRPYDLSGSNRAEYQIETDGIVENLFMSPGKTVLLIYDSSDTLTLWSADNKELLGTINLPSGKFMEGNYIFKDEDTLFYSDLKNLYEYTVSTGEEKIIAKCGDFSFIERIRYDFSTGILYTLEDKTITGYSSNGYSKCFEYTFPSGELVSNKFRYLAGSNVAAISTLGDTDIVRVIDKDANVIFEKSYENEYYEGSYLIDDKLFILTTSYNKTNGFISGTNSIVRTYSLESGNQLWERSDLGLYGNKLAPIKEDDGDFLVEIGKYGVAEMDINDGSLVTIDYSENEILWTGAVETAVIYLTNKPVKMYLTGHSTMGRTSEIECNLDAISLMEYTVDGYFIVPRNSKRVIYYTVQTGDVFEEYTDDFKQSETDNLGEFTHADEIKDLGLEEEAIVRNVAYDKDHEYICVTGKDWVARVYKLSNMEMVASWKLENGVDVIDEYLGTDGEGNTYWASQYRGYCISKDNKLIAEMDVLRGVDAKNNKLIFGYRDSDELYEAPIYSTDDLIKMAEEYIKNK